MSILQAIVLAIVQGVTEFLPVSSSGHLVIASWLFGWPDQGVVFDAAVHVGTLAAVLVYFAPEWLALARGVVRGTDAQFRGEGSVGSRRLIGLVVVATIPVAIAGYFLKDALSGDLRSPTWAASFLIVTAAILVAGEKLGNGRRQIPSLGLPDAVRIGIAQAFAVLPGISRSGTTISAGLTAGLGRETAARFSFLLAVPALFGAGVFVLGDAVATNESVDWAVVAIGVAVSFAAGLLAIGGLLRLLRTGTLYPFAAYCALAGVAVLIARAAGA